MDDDFYIGYATKAPDSLARWTKRAAAAMVVSVLAAGVLLILDQPQFAGSRFEYGVFREYEGVLEEWPYPILLTRDASFLLVAPGKHGLAVAKGLDGRTVRLEGSLIERGGDKMLEVIPASLRETAPLAVSRCARLALGPVKLRGEIVDSKCYLGVMNPGNGKVRRDCARGASAEGRQPRSSRAMPPEWSRSCYSSGPTAAL